MKENARIDAEILNSSVEGVNLSGERLGGELGPDPVLLVFLRHLG